MIADFDEASQEEKKVVYNRLKQDINNELNDMGEKIKSIQMHYWEQHVWEQLYSRCREEDKVMKTQNKLEKLKADYEEAEKRKKYLKAYVKCLEGLNNNT